MIIYEELLYTIKLAAAIVDVKFTEGPPWFACSSQDSSMVQ